MYKKQKSYMYQVVRVSENAWQDNRGIIHFERLLIPQKKLTAALKKRTHFDCVDIISDTVFNYGASALRSDIKNLHSVPPGLYVVEMTNVINDGEYSNYVEEYDLILTPYQSILDKTNEG